MRAVGYTGIMADVMAAIHAEDKPRFIEVTRAEMDEIISSDYFRTTVSKYYGGSDTLTLNSIVNDMDGKVTSFYLEDTQVIVNTWTKPEAVENYEYAPLTENAHGSTAFTTPADVNGKTYMLAGTGNPADDFVVGSNANIELALAVRKANDSTYYGAGGGTYSIELGPNEDWTFAVSVGSLNADLPRITEMYDIKLYLDTDPTNAESMIVWDLRWNDGKGMTSSKANYMWYNAGGITPVITDSTSNSGFSVTQMIQKYKFPFINRSVAKKVERNKSGSPYGMFTITLEATPRYARDGDAISVSVIADITKAS